MTIECVHYDITDLCNAGCPQCPRTDAKGCKPQPWLRKHASSLDEFRRLSPPEMIEGLSSAYFCGNLGDAAVVPDLIDILSYCWTVNPKLRLQLHTNASVRAVGWWRDLAGAAKGHRFTVIAAIDGASQATNHLYRVRTSFERILANLAAFIEAGGQAEWRMLVFRHNEHEIEEAERLSKAMGFIGFRAYPSNRFSGGAFRYTHGGAEFVLEPPVATHAPKVADRHVIAQTDVAMTEAYIDCEAIRKSTAYLDFDGYLLPCCYFGRRLYMHNHGEPSHRDPMLSGIFDAFGMERLNVNIAGYAAARAAYDAFLAHLEPYWAKQEPKLCKSVCGRRRAAPTG